MHGVQPLAVRQVLETYAARGVFRSLRQSPGAAGVTFRFHWLWNAPFALTVEKSGALVLRDVLPGIQAGSEIESGVKAFLRECSSPERVEHRRLDRLRVSVTYSNRRGRASLRFRVKDGDLGAGTRQAIQLVNEMFVGYLSARQPSYLAEYFHFTEE